MSSPAPRVIDFSRNPWQDGEKVIKVLLEDGKWYEVKDKSFTCDGEWFSFLFCPNYNHYAARAECSGPMSGIRGVISRP